MLVARPIGEGDLGAFVALAREAGPGMTNLPASRALLRRRIRGSEALFASADPTASENAYLFALEDPDHGRVVGCSGIIAAVGLTRPFYSYRRLKFPHVSRELGKFDSVEALQLVNEYAGATELGMLFLSSGYRGGGNGRFLSRSRFLFMAAFPERFSDRVIAEMRGVSGSEGHSPFWEHLGRHFFEMDFPDADKLSAEGRYQFIADLMPKYPIYVRLLPAAARDVIGVPHPNTRAALATLENEGFRDDGCIDVFDAGPTVRCPLDQIRTVQASRSLEVAEIVKTGWEAVKPARGWKRSESEQLVSNTERVEFRATRSHIEIGLDGGVRIPSPVAQALRVKVGDRIRYVG